MLRLTTVSLSRLQRRLYCTSSSPTYTEDHPSNANQLTCLQRFVLTVGSGIGGLMYPERSDLVFTFGETSGYFALQFMRYKMMKDAVGRDILKNKPRIRTDSIDLEALRNLPDRTLGKEYTRFMDHYVYHVGYTPTSAANIVRLWQRQISLTARKGYSPDERAEVKYVEDPELAYVMQRYRESHDFLHTLLGMPTNVYGEIIVKQFEAVQTGLPVSVLGGLVAPIRLSPREQLEMATVYTPWAIKNGLFGRFFMNFYFEKHWEETVEELRRQLSLEAPPPGSLSPNSVWHKQL